MTIEDCRTILKVHICAAEQVGKFASALSLCEVLDAIDAQVAQERAGTNPPHIPATQANEPRYGSALIGNRHSTERLDS